MASPHALVAEYRQQTSACGFCIDGVLRLADSRSRTPQPAETEASMTAFTALVSSTGRSAWACTPTAGVQ